jgi:hypothetical protein
MRWQTIGTDWSYYLPKAKRHWLALTDSQLAAINGSYERLVECLQQSYGLSADVVKDDIREWCMTFGDEEPRSAPEPAADALGARPTTTVPLGEASRINERHFPRRPHFMGSLRPR